MRARLRECDSPVTQRKWSQVFNRQRSRRQLSQPSNGLVRPRHDQHAQPNERILHFSRSFVLRLNSSRLELFLRYRGLHSHSVRHIRNQSRATSGKPEYIRRTSRYKASRPSNKAQVIKHSLLRYAHPMVVPATQASPDHHHIISRTLATT